MFTNPAESTCTHTVSHTVTSNCYSAVNCHNVFLGNSTFFGVKHIFSSTFQNRTQLQIPANNDMTTTLILRYILVFSGKYVIVWNIYALNKILPQYLDAECMNVTT
jgi:hypothetical protein